MIACFQPSGIQERRLEHLLVERPPCQVDGGGAIVGKLSDATDLCSHLIGVSSPLRVMFAGVCRIALFRPLGPRLETVA
jgi:hypothetical protein